MQICIFHLLMFMVEFFKVIALCSNNKGVLNRVTTNGIGYKYNRATFPLTFIFNSPELSFCRTVYSVRIQGKVDMYSFCHVQTVKVGVKIYLQSTILT
jgi:hypothetical protein